MRRLSAIGGLLALAACFVGTLELTGLPCPCVSGYACVNNVCVLPGSGSSGVSGGFDAGCVSLNQLQLADGGLVVCQDVCDYAACVLSCAADGGCGKGEVCDEAVHGCVPTNTCVGASCTQPGGALGVCVEGVCTAIPPSGETNPGCVDGGVDAGSELLTINGIVATFPGAVENDALVNGTVTFTSGNLQPATATIGLSDSLTQFTVQLMPGTWTAEVVATGVVPTFFPNLVFRQPLPGESIRVFLFEVVPVGLASESATGHVVWVGTASQAPACGGTGQDYLSGYTVGLSPSGGGVHYYSATDAGTFILDPALQASAGAGSFIAQDGPAAPTQYVMAVEGNPEQALLSGTFTPPANVVGQRIAVALVYPNVFPP